MAENPLIRFLLPDLNDLLGNDLLSDELLLKSRGLQALESNLEVDALANPVYLTFLVICRDLAAMHTL